MADKRISYEFGTDYRLIGIAASLREYKLCFHLNGLLGCDFRKLKDLVFEPKDRGRSVQFSVFKAGDETTPHQYLIFANKNLGEALLPEVSNYDYLLQIFGRQPEDDLKDLLDGIRAFPEVVMATEIPLKKVKSKDRLIYEEEKPVQKLINRKKLK